MTPSPHYSHTPKPYNSWLREVWCIWFQSSASKDGVCREGDRTSVDPRDLLSLEVFRVKAIQDRQDHRRQLWSRSSDGRVPSQKLAWNLSLTLTPKLMSFLGSHENDHVHQKQRAQEKGEAL